jgi:hypothetical protein
MLYSFRQQRPAPLPNRIRLSNGFTRYAHQPPTAEEILDAGYIAYTEPAYDAATEQLLWVDGAYVIEALPPPIPTPRWVDFSAIVMSLPAINVMLGAVLQAAPGLYGGWWLACRMPAKATAGCSSTPGMPHLRWGCSVLNSSLQCNN